MRPIEVPRLFDLVGRRHLEPHAQYTLFGRLYRFTWENSGRGLILEEWDDFDAHKRIFRTGLEGYVTLTRLGPERAFRFFRTGRVRDYAKRCTANFKHKTAAPGELAENNRLLAASTL